jgi:hypothetical protein
VWWQQQQQLTGKQHYWKLESIHCAYLVVIQPYTEARPSGTNPALEEEEADDDSPRRESHPAIEHCTQATRRASRPKTTPRARTCLRLDTDDDVDVSSSVRIAAADDGKSDGAEQGSQEHPEKERSAGRDDGHEDDEDEREEAQQDDAEAPRRPAAAAPSNQDSNEDAIESMSWWGALTPGQQRSMMRRFLVQPPTAAPATTADRDPGTGNGVAAQAAREVPEDRRLQGAGERVRGSLVSDDPSGGGETWTADELFYGATAHLKDAASKWTITLRETMRPEDKMLDFLVRTMRKKYGRCDTMFNIQNRLAARVQQPGERLSDYAASLTSIGFGQRVPAESYVQAFINGINSATAALQVRTYDQQTLDEAVQFAEDKCGEYGEGFKVTDWTRRARRNRRGARPTTTSRQTRSTGRSWAWGSEATSPRASTPEASQSMASPRRRSGTLSRWLPCRR